MYSENALLNIEFVFNLCFVQEKLYRFTNICYHNKAYYFLNKSVKTI